MRHRATCGSRAHTCAAARVTDMSTTTTTTETLLLCGRAYKVSGVMRESGMRCRRCMLEGLEACYIQHPTPPRRPPRAPVAPLPEAAGPRMRMRSMPLRARRQAQACGRRRRGAPVPAAAALASPAARSAATSLLMGDEGSLTSGSNTPRASVLFQGGSVSSGFYAMQPRPGPWGYGGAAGPVGRGRLGPPAASRGYARSCTEKPYVRTEKPYVARKPRVRGESGL